VTNDLLDIDAQLLVLRYGRIKVLQALARIGDQSVEELQLQLRTISERPKPKRAEPSTMDLVAAQTQENPAIAAPLRTLAVRFENRTFLPQLRDVQRFLDRAGIAHSKLKSRTTAAPLLIGALAKLPPDDLVRLAASERSGGDSDYSLLARAIMGTPTPKRPDDTE
jgi:hypothetical protein